LRAGLLANDQQNRGSVFHGAPEAKPGGERNAARHFHERGWAVTILDNLSRRGALENLDWLRRQQQVRFERADIRDFRAMERIVDELRPSAVLHLAAQVAVTSCGASSASRPQLWRARS